MMKDLKSGIEHIKQAKAHMLQATWIMSDCISKLRELEEENAGLRAKLETFIQSDDSYMKLPLDADGEPIHIGDVLYSRGNECRVVSITVKADEACVGAHTDEGVFLPSVNPKYLSRKNLEPLEPEPADSWERLEEDAAKEVCAYAGARSTAKRTGRRRQADTRKARALGCDTSAIMRGSRDARAVPFLAPGFAHARGRRFFGPFADRNGPLNFTIRETAPEFGGILKRSVNKTPGQSRYNSTNREIGEGNELLGGHRAAGAAHGHVREA